jgi:uncharacterized cupredoxin-like copper-binding protein
MYPASVFPRMKRSIAAAFGSLLLVACGGGSSSGSTSGSSSPSSTPSPTAAAPTQAPGPVLQTLMISGTEFAFNPSSEKLAKPGTYDFKFVNTGTTIHALEITGNGVDAKTGSVSAGSSADLKVTLAAGTYTFFCPIDGHRGLGMEATLTVSA